MLAFASFFAPDKRPIRQITVYNSAEGSAPLFASFVAVLRNTATAEVSFKIMLIVFLVIIIFYSTAVLRCISHGNSVCPSVCHVLVPYPDEEDRIMRSLL